MTMLPGSPPSRDLHLGRLVVGLVVAVLGVLWLAQALDLASVDWRVVLPVALIAVGVALFVAGIAGRSPGGLVAAGVVLTVVLAAGTVVDVPFSGGVGDRSYRPSSLQRHTYELAVGKLTLDLTRASGVGNVPLSAHVGIGQLIVVVPRASFGVDVDTHVGIGSSTVFGVMESGVDVNHATPRSTAGGSVVKLDLSVGIGQVEVRRG